MTIPSWLPPEVAADLKAQYPEKLIPIKTELGGVVLRVPPREAILARYPAPPKDSDVRGALKTEDGDLDKDVALAVAATVYPDTATLKGYISKLPMLGPFLAGRAKLAATGLRAEVKGAPDDLNLALAEAAGARPYQIISDLEGPAGRLVLRAPSADAIRQWESARQKQSGIVASETFVLACLLHPTAAEAVELFRQRPLLGIYCANRLFAWGLGEVEEFEQGF